MIFSLWRFRKNNLILSYNIVNDEEGFLVWKFHEKVANTPIPTLKAKFTDVGGSFSQIIGKIKKTFTTNYGEGGSFLKQLAWNIKNAAIEIS